MKNVKNTIISKVNKLVHIVKIDTNPNPPTKRHKSMARTLNAGTIINGYKPSFLPYCAQRQSSLFMIGIFGLRLNKFQNNKKTFRLKFEKSEGAADF